MVLTIVELTITVGLVVDGKFCMAKEAVYLLYGSSEAHHHSGLAVRPEGKQKKQIGLHARRGLFLLGGCE